MSKTPVMDELRRVEKMSQKTSRVHLFVPDDFTKDLTKLKKWRDGVRKAVMSFPDFLTVDVNEFANTARERFNTVLDGFNMFDDDGEES